MFHPHGPTLVELARQALSSTTQGYDLLAPQFDVTPFRTPEPLLATAARLTCQNKAPSRVVDLCCGTGAALRAFRPYVQEQIVGVDLSAGMLVEAHKRIDPGPDVRLIQADVLDFESEAPFDLALCFGAFGHIVGDDEERFVRAIHRLLVPGGRFVFVTADVPPLLSVRALIARGFNAAMHIRNALIRPPFIMFYLTFLVPRARALLEAHGFRVELKRDVFEPPFREAVFVEATRL